MAVEVVKVIFPSGFESVLAKIDGQVMGSYVIMIDDKPVWQHIEIGAEFVAEN